MILKKSIVERLIWVYNRESVCFAYIHGISLDNLPEDKLWSMPPPVAATKAFSEIRQPGGFLKHISPGIAKEEIRLQVDTRLEFHKLGLNLHIRESAVASGGRRPKQAVDGPCKTRVSRRGMLMGDRACTPPLSDICGEFPEVT